MNFNYEIDKINPISISNEEFSIYEISDNVRKSIGLYNKSIRNLKINCVDLAIADLKKALSLNPNFYEAMKLLGLCYIYKKNFNKARKLFKKLAEYDVYTEIANKYLREIRNDRATSKTLTTIKNTKKLIIVFMVVIVIVAVASGIYFNTSSIQSVFNRSQNAELEKNKDIDQQKSIDEKNKEMNEKLERLKKEQEAEKTKIDSNNKNNVVLILNDAENFYSEGNYEKALDNLITLKSLKLDGAEKSRFDKLWNGIKANNVWNIYNEGNKLYKQGNYQDALQKLLKVQQLAPELEVMPWAIYQIGNCYKQTNDNKNALIFFQKVMSDYPNTQYARYSEEMINEINNNK
ncbi:tetratricopeptide repeat protein [Clostridium thailandense]|uniref:tetratricopeptide repeat protein n=1 Tax=Clostridium thailandense TaxID=2794346 RepID=UPI0039899AE1